MEAQSYSCSGGAAAYYDMELLKTQGNQIITTLRLWPSDGLPHTQLDIAVHVGTSYYYRWRGANQFQDIDYSRSPCQFVLAYPTQ